MRHLPHTEPRSELLDSLKEFLDAQSRAPARTQYCSRCESVLRYLPTQFWLEGAENGWNIGLPYCAHCHPFPLMKETLAA